MADRCDSTCTVQKNCDGQILSICRKFRLNIDKFLVKVKDLLKKKSSVVIAVSEGIRLADGRYVCELGSSGDYVDAIWTITAGWNCNLSCKFPCSRMWL